MTQESWNYFLNSSYVMLIALLIPTHYRVIISINLPPPMGGEISEYVNSFLYWIFGLIATKHFSDAPIEFSYSPYMFVISLVSTFMIITASILLNLLARRIKNGKIAKLRVLQLIAFIQTILISLSFFFFPYFPFFGYILWIFAIYLLWKGFIALKVSNNQKVHNINPIFGFWIVITLVFMFVDFFRIFSMILYILERLN